MICPEAVRSEVVYDVVLENKFKKIASAVLSIDPCPSVYEIFHVNKIAGFYRAIQIAVYGGEKQIDIYSIYTSGRYYIPMEITKNPPFLVLFNRPFRPDIFNCLNPAIRFKTLNFLLDEAEKNLEPVSDVIKYYVNLLCQQPDWNKPVENSNQVENSDINTNKRNNLKKSNNIEEAQPNSIKNNFKIKKFKTSLALMDFLLFCGNIAEFKKIEVKFSDSTYHLAYRGWAHMICNNNDEALICFKAALGSLKKETRKRKIFFQGYSGLLFLLALLKSESRKDHETALTCIDHALRDETHLSPVIRAIKPLFQEKLGLPFAPEQYSINFLIQQERYLIIFFSVLIISWTDKTMARSHIPALENILEKAVASDLFWLEAEIYALFAILDHDSAVNGKLSKNIHKKCGTTSMTTIIKPMPKWEKILTSLINIGEQVKQKTKSESEGKAPAKKQRLIWLLNHSETYNFCNITPRLQTLSKVGTWTKGRAVALKNLYKNHITMEWLNKQDKMVCSAIMEESYSTGYGYYRNQTEYIFDHDKALPALVGHPLLFIEGSLNGYNKYIPVELVEGDPEVRLRKNKGKINISMHPMPNTEYSNTLVVKETPSRFKLIRFSKEHERIAELLGTKGLALPKNAKKMAGLAIESLACLAAVNSDLAPVQNENVKKIKADSTPHAHIMPWQRGIKIEFLIRPFINAGSCFKPGRGGANVFAEVKGKQVQTTRNLNGEKKNVRDVIDQCPTLTHLEEIGGQWLVADSEDALELLIELKNCADKKNLILEWPQGEKIKVRSEVSFNNLNLSLKKDRQWFKASGTLIVDENLSLDLIKLMELLDKPSTRFITMDDGTFLAITHSLKERLEELKAYSSVHGKELRLTPLAAPAIEELTSEVKALKTDQAWKNHCRKLKEIIKPEIPGTLQADLRDYQKDGFKWLAQLMHWNVGACLADDMGLGKTVQAIAAILIDADKGPSLVIAPLSVMGNWQEECLKFAPTLNPLFFGSGNRQQFLDNLGPFDLVISSYGLLQVEAEKLSLIKWQTLILDEAQAIKNMKTKRSKAAMNLKSQFRMITTGTPVENHLDELWTLFHFLNPGLLGTFNHFKNAFAVPIERDQDKKASQRLKKLISPFILRRLKTNVLKELPAKTEITLKVEMNKEEAVLYEAQRLKAIANIENADDKPGQKHLRILAELMKLRQICCNPALVLPDAGIESSKLKVFGDIVNDLIENRHKALVFSQFTGHLSILRKFLDSKKIAYQYLDGSTPAKKRKKRINDFQSGMGDLFLISLKAGGFGLNLTAADYVIHMDPWWNPAVEDQASDRAHRIGQSRPVTVYRLVVKDSIEEKILNLHKAKRDLAENLLSGSDMAGKISANDLLKLLHGK